MCRSGRLITITLAPMTLLKGEGGCVITDVLTEGGVITSPLLVRAARQLRYNIRYTRCDTFQVCKWHKALAAVACSSYANAEHEEQNASSRRRKNTRPRQNKFCPSVNIICRRSRQGLRVRFEPFWGCRQRVLGPSRPVPGTAF